MAGVTYTYTLNMAAAPKGTHVGENVLPFVYESGANKVGTLSDVVLLGKIPNGALVTGANVRLASKAEAAHFALVLLVTDALGTYSAYATLINSMTASATAVSNFSGYLPTKVSLSDDRAVQYVTLALNCTTGASGTTSFSTQGSVRFLTDGSNV